MLDQLLCFAYQSAFCAGFCVGMDNLASTRWRCVALPTQFGGRHIDQTGLRNQLIYSSLHLPHDAAFVDFVKKVIFYAWCEPTAKPSSIEKCNAPFAANKNPVVTMVTHIHLLTKYQTIRQRNHDCDLCQRVQSKSDHFFISR